jgi:hypothetical protein
MITNPNICRNGRTGRPQINYYHYCLIESGKPPRYFKTHIDLKNQMGICRSALNTLVAGKKNSKYENINITRCNIKIT